MNLFYVYINTILHIKIPLYQHNILYCWFIPEHKTEQNDEVSIPDLLQS
jgi:hypothetical protein